MFLIQPSLHNIHILDECTTLWGEPDQVHLQNMEQLNAHDHYQNATEPQATENH